MVTITPARPADIDPLGRLMFDAIRSGATLYSVQQRAAWIPSVPSGKRWHARLRHMHVFVARSPTGLLGFAAMTSTGYVDFAYVRKTARGRGVFKALLEQLTALDPQRVMTTHASLHAQPAFRAVGFRVVHHEHVRRNGQRLDRAFMRRV